MSSFSPVYKWQAWIVYNWKGPRDIIHFHPDKSTVPYYRGFYRMGR